MMIEHLASTGQKTYSIIETLILLQIATQNLRLVKNDAIYDEVQI